MRVFLFKKSIIYNFSIKCLSIQFLTETLDRAN